MIQIFSTKYFHESISGLITPLLPQDADVWVRDYHPVAVQDSTDEIVRYLAFRYQPKYLPAGAATVARESARLLVDNVEQIDLILDGGNLIHNGRGTLILTERVLADNKLTARQLQTELSAYFEIRRLIIIPEEPGDRTGHADGAVRFLSTNVLAVNQYHQETEAQKTYRLKLHRIQTRHFNVVNITSEHPLEILGEGFPSAWGLRINWLRWHNKVLFPASQIDRDHELYKILKKSGLTPVPLPIGAFELYTHFGGSLHCLTAPYWPSP